MPTFGRLGAVAAATVLASAVAAVTVLASAAALARAGVAAAEEVKPVFNSPSGVSICVKGENAKVT